MQATRSKKQTTSLDLILMLFSFLEKTGIAPQTICDIVGVPFSHFQNKENQVTLAEEEALWQTAIEQSNDPDFGLHFGMGFQGHAKGNILVALILNSPNLEDALKKVVKYHDFLHEGGSSIQLETKPTTVHLLFHYSSESSLLTRHFTDSFFASMVQFVSHVSDFKIVPQKIRMAYPQPKAIDVHQSVFRAPLEFNCAQNELIFTRTPLQAPILSANSEVLQMLENHVRNHIKEKKGIQSWSNRVMVVLENLVYEETISVERVAQRLGVGVRTLQNHLKKEQTTFRLLWDEVRKEIALDYLSKSQESIADIAFLLGYSEQSSFTKAFKLWTGVTPNQYRQN